MFCVLIVDDEGITRRGLKSHVDWKKLEIDKVYDSGSALEALELVKKVKPDLILSDVCMPEMNGIEMCTRIRAIHKECQIVFLSGYSDKEYLKGAIRLEAVSYVEKPISIEEVETALSQAVEKQRMNRQKKEKLRRLVTENYSMTAKHLIEKLSIPHVKRDLLEQDFKKLQLDWENMQEYAVVLYKLCSREKKEPEIILREIKRDFRGSSYIYSIKAYGYLVFVCAFPESGTAALQEIAERIQQSMLRYGQSPYYCAVGETVASVETIYASYQSAVITMQQMRFWNKARFGLAAKWPEERLDFDEQVFADFSQAAKQYREEDAVRAMKRLYLFMQRRQTVMVSSIKGIYFRFVEVLFQKAEFGVKTTYDNASIVGMIWEKLHEIDSLDGCQRYLEEETADYFKNMEELAQNNQTMLRIIAYIQSNYKDTELCLENIAENVYLTPNYLSSLFKKKMGKTISQYITEIRVQHAKELLRDRSMKLYDVALNTGYKDANYFTKIFKKAYGVTPSEYREKYNI